MSLNPDCKSPMAFNPPKWIELTDHSLQTWLSRVSIMWSLCSCTGSLKSAPEKTAFDAKDSMPVPSPDDPLLIWI